MPETLTIAVGIASIVAVCLSIYTIVDNKHGTKKKELTQIKDKLGDHEARIVATEKITNVVEEYMEDLLLESLKRR